MEVEWQHDSLQNLWKAYRSRGPGNGALRVAFFVLGFVQIPGYSVLPHLGSELGAAAATTR